MNKTPTTLIIMDGFGLMSASGSNAVTLAKTPVLDRLFATCPNTWLISSRINWVPYFEYMITQVLNGQAIDADWAGTIENGAVALTGLGQNVAPGTAEKLEEVKAKIIAKELNVFDTANFTVGGKKLESYLADVDTDDKFTPDTEAIENGVFYESKFRSGPYFDIQIDGIKLLDTNFG